MPDILGFIGILIVFAAMLFLAYVTTRYIAGKAGSAMKGRYLSIVESLSIGPDKQLHIVKAGGQYILIASAGKSIEYLASLSMEEVIGEQAAEINNGFDFKIFFDKYLQNFKKSSRAELKTNDSETKIKLEGEVFKSNLTKLKTINFKVSDQIKNDGDENTNETWKG